MAFKQPPVLDMKTKEKFKRMKVPPGYRDDYRGFYSATGKFVAFAKPYALKDKQGRIAEMWRHHDFYNNVK